MSYSLSDYNIKVFLDKKDKDYIAYIEEIPECSAFGSSPGQAIRELETAYELWKETSEEKSYPIPKPMNLKDHSGKFLLRIPKSLHRELTEKALSENISLNQYALYCLTRGMKA